MHEAAAAAARRSTRAIPRDLETIVHKAIDRDPAHRYPTAGELADDLQRFLGDEPIHARRVSVAPASALVQAESGRGEPHYRGRHPANGGCNHLVDCRGVLEPGPHHGERPRRDRRKSSRYGAETSRKEAETRRRKP